MSDVAYAKCACESCDLHIEFPLEAAGKSVACPGCGKETELGAIAITSPEPPADASVPQLTSAELIGAFTGPILRTPVSFFYQVGLVFVTLTMLLLPILYVAMIGAAAWAVYYWATHFTFLLSSIPGRGRIFLLKLVIYGAPLFAGVVLVLFMIKPLFARRAPRSQPLALNPGAEPLLFAFIAKVCETVGAPFPKRIDLDCELNASAGFRRGVWSLLGNDLVLTIGLPLVAALNLREFAGVLAHEFGHFTQGFGMRLSYVVRTINGWFARVIYERDALDLWLDELAETEATSLTIVVACAQLAVWFSRQLLTLLMLLGHGIGCFMLRQMEYDADSYEIKLAGSEVFEDTTRRMHVLNHALASAYKNMRPAWNINRTMPESFPAYLLRTEGSMQPSQRQKLEDTMGLAVTGLFHTHPSEGDRIRRARQATEPGVFHLDAPATALFAHFEVPARQVTLLHYADDLGIPTLGLKLVPVMDAPETASETTMATGSRTRPQVERKRFRVKLKPPA